MKSNTLKHISAAALALGSFSTVFAGSFSETAEHLDLDGDFVGYMDFDGDGQDIGEKLNIIYQDLAAVNPQMPPFPLDFPAMLETLGFGSVKSIGMSSTEVEPGLHRNRSVTMLDGDPAGLFEIYGLDNIEFRSANLAPADATTVLSGRLNFEAVVSTAQALASQVMGPMGEGMVAQGMTQPIPGTDITAGEAVTALSGGMDLILSQGFEDPENPEFKVWLSLKGAGPMLSRFQPLLSSMDIQVIDTGAGQIADLSAMLQDSPFAGLFLEAPGGSNDLLIYTDADWVSSFGIGPSLSDTEDFQRVAGRLPEDAAFYAYSSGFDLSQLQGLLERSDDMAVMAPAIVNAVDSLYGGFVAPSASATYREGDVLITDAYAGYSYKGLVMVLPTSIAVGAGVGIVVEQSKKAREMEEGE